MPRKPRIPAYRLHKPTGQAVVTLSGRDFYLGIHSSESSRRQYEELLGEWLANGRKLPEPVICEDDKSTEITITELVASYWPVVEDYYQKNGEPTSEVNGNRCALRELRKMFGRTAAADFGPRKLKVLRESLIQRELARNVVNQYIGRIVRAFRWASSEEMVPASLYHGLLAVRPLQRGRSKAKEMPRVLPIDDAIVDMTIEELGPIVADMVRLQRLTGMRPTEVCTLRPVDIDRTSEVWIYKLASHKTEHHDRGRMVPIGPKGQALLRPYLLRDETCYCFNPAESVEQLNREKRLNRKTKVQPSQQDRSKPDPERKPGDRYDSNSYRRAIQRACDRLEIERWTPNRLRHSAATEIRKQFGLEAAQVSLGHSSADVTQVYAERDLELAKKVAKKLG